MMLGASLIFDKSSLESLNLNEAVLLDNFYSSVITPIFFVECLADLEKNIRSKSTPEQLADRTPECGCRVTVHRLLRAELCGCRERQDRAPMSNAPRHSRVVCLVTGKRAF